MSNHTPILRTMVGGATARHTLILTAFVGGALALSGPVLAEDCNGNGIDDACDLDCGIASGPCDIPGCGGSFDCNNNGVPDECDVAGGVNWDANGNGVPDECEAIYVEQTGNCPGDGSETMPFCTIGDAVVAANDGDVIIISPGTYQENIDLGDRSLTLRSVAPDDPNVVDATIIDGSGDSQPAIRQHPQNTPLPTTVISGLTVTGAQSSGLDISNTNTTLSYCHIRDNNGKNGGVLSFFDNGNVLLIVDHCRITGNSSTIATGAGMTVFATSANLDVTITNTRFAFNSADCTPFACNSFTAGALLMYRVDNAVVRDCTFEDNSDVHAGSPDQVGGVLISSPTSEDFALVKDCVFKRNSPLGIKFEQQGTLQNNYFCSNVDGAYSIVDPNVDDIDNALALTCDCNENGVDDDLDISNGTSLDVDPADHVPDECQILTACCLSGACEMMLRDDCVSLGGRAKALGVTCDENSYCGPPIPGDFDDDGDVDLGDYGAFQEAFTGPQ